MMIVRLLLLVLTILPFSASLHGGIWSDVVDTFRGRSKPTPPVIRVLVTHDVESVQLEVKGKYTLFDPYTDSYISSRFIGKSRQVQALSDGLKWGEAFPGLYQIKVKPDDASTVMVVDGKEYGGSIYVYDIGGTISIVNQVLVEDFIRLVLADYQGDHLHPEMLAALAIVARTNAYFQAVNPKNTYWAIDAQKVGYQGLVHVPSDVEEAVRLTRYMIMSRTGVYEGMATPFPAQLNGYVIGGQPNKEMETAKISLEEANKMAENGEHAAQILAKAFPGTTIMLMEYAN
ncbi:SpoIID/LytB domain-containing protein [Candidatus Protochlamydia naegleriophila]|nr:SpoIID/LytB domain-containing protein [Candidatus Protochlamydia naegleriophila]